MALEFALLFIAIPGFFYFGGNRLVMAIALWSTTVYAAIMLQRMKTVSWRDVWHGNGWLPAQRRLALLRFLLAIPLVVALTWWLAPQHLFRFPIERTRLWLTVMLLYPLVSALPQELLFRSFFFRRYARLLPQPWLLVTVNTLCFALLHIVFHNWVSPLLSAGGSLIFALSYRQHHALKWAAVEHAAYGCLIFTVGIGFYFVTVPR